MKKTRSRKSRDTVPLSVDIYDISMTFDLAKRVNNEKFGSLQQRSIFSSTVPYRGKNRHMKKKLFAYKVGNCT